MTGNMIVIDHTIKTVFDELINILGLFKYYRMRIVNNQINHLTWRSIQDLYLTIDNLVLEMASGMKLDQKKGFKKMTKLYFKNSIPDEYLYTTALFVPDKKKIFKGRKEITRKRGRPRKNNI